MKALIIDDASQARKLLRLMLAEISTETEVVAEAENADEALLLVKKHQPELLFLDIEMPGKSGLQLLEELNALKINAETVFVTAYSQYAIQAFKLSAVDYLLKPFRKTELQDTIQKVKERREQKKSVQQLDVLLGNLKSNHNQTLCIPLNYGYEYLPIDSIEYLEANGAYTFFHLNDERKILVSKNLKHYETILCGLDIFVKINRSYIVQLKGMKSYRKQERGTVVLNSGKSIKLSPNCAEDFFKKVDSFSL